MPTTATPREATLGRATLGKATPKVVIMNDLSHTQEGHNQDAMLRKTSYGMVRQEDQSWASCTYSTKKQTSGHNGIPDF